MYDVGKSLSGRLQKMNIYMEQKIYNLIILDESGSMQSIKPQAITGLNETFQTIESAQDKYENQSH